MKAFTGEDFRANVGIRTARASPVTYRKQVSVFFAYVGH